MKKVLVVFIVLILVVAAFFIGRNVDFNSSNNSSSDFDEAEISLSNTNQEKAVPEIIIYDEYDNKNDADYKDKEIYSIVHSYNTYTHIDRVTVTLREEGEYGYEECIDVLDYQYYASDDIWQIVNEEKAGKNIYWYEEKIETVWKNQGKDFYLEIHNINNETKEVTVSYEINVRDNYNEIMDTLQGQYVTVKLDWQCIELFKEGENMFADRFAWIFIGIHRGVYNYRTN